MTEKIKVGDCFKSKVFGGYEYASIVYDSGSGMYRADTVKITKGGFGAEVNQHIMHWQFREYDRISRKEFENAVDSVINTMQLIRAGNTRNQSRDEI